MTRMNSLRETIRELKRQATQCDRKAQHAAKEGRIESAEAYTALAVRHVRMAAMLSVDLMALEAE